MSTDVRPGYKQTEVGVIPEDWEVRPVSDMGEVRSGKALAARGPGHLRPYLRPKNVFDGRIDLDDVLLMLMTDETGDDAGTAHREGTIGMNTTRSATVQEVTRFFDELRPLLAGSPRATLNVQPFDVFFSGAGQIIMEEATRDSEMNRRQAHRFNLLSWIDPDENKISDLLADLLDPKGQHGQGDRFLGLLFQHLGVAWEGSATVTTRIQREAVTHGIEKYRRRIDILIESSVIVAIENKIDSDDQIDQVSDYMKHLRVISNAWSRPASLIYLTPNGRNPNSLPSQEQRQHREQGHLHCWSYTKDLREWLEKCRADCEADKIRYFLGDFISYIDASLRRETAIEANEEQP